MRIPRKGCWLTLAALGFLMPAGCSNTPPTPAKVSQPTAETKPAQPAADTVSVKMVKYEGMQDALKQLKGKVIVVDVWAVW